MKKYDKWRGGLCGMLSDLAYELVYAPYNEPSAVHKVSGIKGVIRRHCLDPAGFPEASGPRGRTPRFGDPYRE